MFTANMTPGMSPFTGQPLFGGSFGGGRGGGGSVNVVNTAPNPYANRTYPAAPMPSAQSFQGSNTGFTGYTGGYSGRSPYATMLSPQSYSVNLPQLNLSPIDAPVYPNRQQVQVNQGGVWSPSQIGQQVNASLAQNNAANVRQTRANAADLAGRGYGSSSPLLYALNNASNAQRMFANAEARREIPWQAAQGNRQAELQGQANAANYDIGLRRNDIEQARIRAENDRLLRQLQAQVYGDQLGYLGQAQRLAYQQQRDAA